MNFLIVAIVAEIQSLYCYWREYWRQIFWIKVEKKINVLFLPGKPTERLYKTVCPFLKEVVRFYSNGSKRTWSAHGQSLTDWWWVIRSHHLQPSGSTQSGVYLLVGSIQLNSSTWWEFLYLQNSFKILVCISLEGELGLYSKVALLFLDCIPSFPISKNLICPL